MSTDQSYETGRIAAATPPRPPVGARPASADRDADTSPDLAADATAEAATAAAADSDAPSGTPAGAAEQVEDDDVAGADASTEPAAATGAAATGAAGPTRTTTVVRRGRSRGRWGRLSRTSHRVLLVLVAALLGSAVALTGNLVKGPEYTSQAGVLWDPASAQLVDQNVSVDPNLLDRQVTDQQDVIDSDAVISAASDELGMSPTDLRESIATSVTQGSSLITISGVADTPAEATRIAAAVTDAYVAALKTNGAASLNARADALQSTIDRQNAQLATLNEQLTAQTNQLAGVPQTSSTFAVLQGQVTQLSGQVSDLTTRIGNSVDQQEGLRADATIYPGAAYVLQQADEPKKPSTFSIPVTIALGAALGALLAGCVIGIQVFRQPSAAQRRADDAASARG